LEEVIIMNYKLKIIPLIGGKRDRVAIVEIKIPGLKITQRLK